ncbi:hypothetical protein COCNU_14G010060 [Cocos nucifera]|uniref:Uncharacterized protein n=1 Tax=Cocos nucifera TaxID=13894 RepID=A0A8K0IWE9_COCNU|nr:hypothetical protein COCNU_14G010060 [Cocos nucifera]
MRHRWGGGGYERGRAGVAGSELWRWRHQRGGGGHRRGRAGIAGSGPWRRRCRRDRDSRRRGRDGVAGSRPQCKRHRWVDTIVGEVGQGRLARDLGVGDASRVKMAAGEARLGLWGPSSLGEGRVGVAA